MSNRKKVDSIGHVVRPLKNQDPCTDDCADSCRSVLIDSFIAEGEGGTEHLRVFEERLRKFCDRFLGPNEEKVNGVDAHCEPCGYVQKLADININNSSLYGKIFRQLDRLETIG